MRDSTGVSDAFLRPLDTLLSAGFIESGLPRERSATQPLQVCTVKRFRKQAIAVESSAGPPLPVRAPSQVPSEASWDMIANPVSVSASSVSVPIVLPLRPKAPPPAPSMQRLRRTLGAQPRVGTSMFSLALRGVPEFADEKPLQRPLLLRVPGVLGPSGFGLSDDPLPPPVFRHRSSYPGFKSVLDDDIPPVEFPSSMQDCGKECTFVGQKRAASAVSLQADRSQASVVASNLKVQQVAGHRPDAVLHGPSVAAKRPRNAGGALQADVHARNWSQVFVLWALMVSSLEPASQILRQAAASVNSEAITKSLLSRVSDTTALRYLKVIQIFLKTCSDLGFAVQSLSAVQLIDIVCAMRSEPRQKIHSTNSLKAIRWLVKILQLEWCVFSPMMQFFDGPRDRQRREALPFPLRFASFLESRLRAVEMSLGERAFAGAVMLLIVSSLRFSDASHVEWRSLSMDAFDLRGLSTRTKTSSNGMPFAASGLGFLGCPGTPVSSWVCHYLQVLGCLWDQMCSHFGDAFCPDTLFFLWDPDEPVSFR